MSGQFPLLAQGFNWQHYWNGFLKFWGDFLGQQDGVITTALLVALASAFIITRGKWRK